MSASTSPPDLGPVVPMPAAADLYARLEHLLQRHHDLLEVQTLAECSHHATPLQAISIGNAAPTTPRCLIVGGIHGNETIGVEVVVAFLHSLLEQMRWDQHLRALFEQVRLIVIPVANPTGFAAGTRATAAGIDLMRNAPIRSRHAHWLVGGQRLSKRLPWYCGRNMAPELDALVRLVDSETAHCGLTLSVDCHSGFGAIDRIWFPWAHQREPMPHLAEVYALRNLFRRTYPNHAMYRIEPQCQHYMTHGDVWDYLYARSLARGQGVHLPLTLEMGSWLWVRKNPLQIFNRYGLFNPLVPHRRRRILRQHLVFLNFLLHATASGQAWLPVAETRTYVMHQAQRYWRKHFADRPDAPTTADPAQPDAADETPAPALAATKRASC